MAAGWQSATALRICGLAESGEEGLTALFPAALYQTVVVLADKPAASCATPNCYPMRIAHCRKGVEVLAMSEVILTALISGGFSLSVPEAGSTNPAV